MSSLSRTYARASKRGKKLMEQHQGPGAYQESERQYNENLKNKKLDREMSRNKK